jgi:hypothetical protein
MPRETTGSDDQQVEVAPFVRRSGCVGTEEVDADGRQCFDDALHNPVYVG